MKRVRKFANSQLKEAFASRLSNGTPYYDNVRSSYRDAIGEESFAELDQKINSETTKEVKNYFAPYEFEKQAFLDSDQPKHMKERVDEIIKKPADRLNLDYKQLMTSDVSEAKRKMQNTLYPSDWAKQRLSLLKPEDPEYQYWNSVLSDVNQEDDKAYEEDITDLSESLSDDYNSSEARSVSQEVQSARGNARKNFESKVSKIRSETDAAKQQVQQIAQENIKQGGSKKLWDSKVAQADYLSRNDVRLLDAFQQALPSSLERKINAKSFELFKVDKALVEQYRGYTKLQNEKEHQRQAAREQNSLEYREWLQRAEKENEHLDGEIKKFNTYMDWMDSKEDSMTVAEFYHTHPQVWAYVEWRLSRHRLDFDKSDEQYKVELAKDHTYWPLPRNP